MLNLQKRPGDKKDTQSIHTGEKLSVMQDNSICDHECVTLCFQSKFGEVPYLYIYLPTINSLTFHTGEKPCYVSSYVLYSNKVEGDHIRPSRDVNTQKSDFTLQCHTEEKPYEAFYHWYDHSRTLYEQQTAAGNAETHLVLLSNSPSEDFQISNENDKVMLTSEKPYCHNGLSDARDILMAPGQRTILVNLCVNRNVHNFAFDPGGVVALYQLL